MLNPREFSCGSLWDAEHLSIMIPRSTYEKSFIVGRIGGIKVACHLDDGESFSCCKIDQYDSNYGLIIPNIYIEVDQNSAFDPKNDQYPLGSIIRSETQLSIIAADGHPRIHRKLVTLQDNLPALPQVNRVGFASWQIVLGIGPDKRIIKVFNLIKVQN